MEIEQLIKEEAPDYGEFDSHDYHYAACLREAYRQFNGLSKKCLEHYQTIRRDRYDGTHTSVACCVVLYNLLKEPKDGD